MDCYDIQYEIASFLEPWHYSGINRSFYSISKLSSNPYHDIITFASLYCSNQWDKLYEWIVNNVSINRMKQLICKGSVCQEFISNMGRIFKHDILYLHYFDEAINSNNILLVQFMKNCVHNECYLNYYLLLNQDKNFIDEVGITDYDIVHMSLPPYYMLYNHILKYYPKEHVNLIHVRSTRPRNWN